MIMKANEEQLGRQFLTDNIVDAMDDLGRLAKIFQEDSSLDAETKRKVLECIRQADQDFSAIVDRLDAKAK